jgi:hypothetical protein
MNNVNIKDGISYNDGKLDIDLNKDWYGDIVLFFKPNLNNKIFSRSGISVFFGHTLVKPDFKGDEEKRNFVRTSIKNFNSLPSNIQKDVLTLINTSIKKLNEVKPLNEFDMVVSVESTAPLNKVLIQQFKPYLRQDAVIVDDLFVKNSIDQVDLNWEMLDREKSEKTKEQVLDLYNKIMKSKQLFFIKDLRTGFRRYFINFLKFKDSHQKQTFESIFNKNILLVDDTVGEVSTFRDMIRLLTEYKPKECFCYAFLKDY